MKADDLASNRLAIDTNSLGDLRSQANKDPKAALHRVAQQFEALFLQMVLKSMRDATPQDGLMDSEQTRLYTSMLDQQLAQKFSTSGQLGFAKLIEKQLGANMPTNPAANATNGLNGLNSVAPALGNGLVASPEEILSSPSAVRAILRGQVPGLEAAKDAAPASDGEGDEEWAMEAAPVAVGGFRGRGAGSARDFVNRLWPDAVAVSRATNIPAQFMVGHAALETGWGRSEIRKADGSPSYNLFGIKAGKSWAGASVEATTTEYVNGSPQTVRARFRAYNSYAEAFQDYANLLQKPRFAGVLNQRSGTDFARSLQQAGYATDPLYADKLSRIINGATLRQALLG